MLVAVVPEWGLVAIALEWGSVISYQLSVSDREVSLGFIMYLIMVCMAIENNL